MTLMVDQIHFYGAKVSAATHLSAPAGFGVYDGERFEVLEGSRIGRTEYKSLSPTIARQRRSALKNGDVTDVNSEYVLNKSMSFSSPSSAAMFVLGTSANGWVEWKSKDGKTLDKLFRK